MHLHYVLVGYNEISVTLATFVSFPNRELNWWKTENNRPLETAAVEKATLTLIKKSGIAIMT